MIVFSSTVLSLSLMIKIGNLSIDVSLELRDLPHTLVSSDLCPGRWKWNVGKLDRAPEDLPNDPFHTNHQTNNYTYSLNLKPTRLLTGSKTSSGDSFKIGCMAWYPHRVTPSAIGCRPQWNYFPGEIDNPPDPRRFGCSLNLFGLFYFIDQSYC